MTSSSTTTDPTHDSLQFAVGGDRPSIPGLTVYGSTEATLAGARFEFAVIGSSHLVAAPSVGFYETVSCKDVGVDGAATLPLSRDVDETVEWSADGLAGTTEVRGDALSAFDAGRGYDLRYDFAERAVTAIDLRDAGYRTYHTYPEVDLTLVTETRLREG